MANTIAIQKIIDGPHNAVIHCTIIGDGSGEETSTAIVDISTLSGTPTAVRIVTVTANLCNFDAALLWDATTDLLALPLPAGSSTTDFKPFGGLVNNSGTGKTGSIMFTTVGLGASEKGSITIEMRKVF